MKFLFSVPSLNAHVTIGARTVEQADKAIRLLYPDAVFLGIAAR